VESGIQIVRGTRCLIIFPIDEQKRRLPGFIVGDSTVIYMDDIGGGIRIILENEFAGFPQRMFADGMIAPGIPTVVGLDVGTAYNDRNLLLRPVFPDRRNNHALAILQQEKQKKQKEQQQQEKPPGEWTLHLEIIGLLLAIITEPMLVMK
jgi:hypothetical protein